MTRKITNELRRKTNFTTPSRRGFLMGAAAGLAAPVFIPKNAWAQDRTLQIMTYTGPQGQYIREHIMPAFTEEFGAKVLQTEAATLANIAQLRTQKNNPQYSIAMMDDAGIPIASEEGLITRLSRDQIPNLNNVHPNYVYRDDFGTAFQISPVLTWHNNSVADPVESYANLWDERFKGRYMMGTPRFTQSVFLVVLASALTTGKPIREAQYDLDSAWDKMAELKPNVQTIYDNSGAAVLQVSQGQADIAGLDHTKSIYPYIDKGAPVTMVNPAEGAFAGINCVTIANNAPEPELAAEFVNMLLSPKFQQGIAEFVFAAPAVVGLDLSEKLRSRVPVDDGLSALHIMDWEYINPKRNGIIERYNEIFGS